MKIIKYGLKAEISQELVDELQRKYGIDVKKETEKVLKEVVSAREDGDLKENSAYHAARETLSILDDKILKEEDRIRREKQK